MPRTESEVKRLGGEVTNDVGGVSSPERNNTLVTVRAGEAVSDALVRRRKTTLLDLKSIG